MLSSLKQIRFIPLDINGVQTLPKCADHSCFVSSNKQGCESALYLSCKRKIAVHSETLFIQNLK